MASPVGTPSAPERERSFRSVEAPLARATSFRIGGVAVEHYSPDSVGDLESVLRSVGSRDPFLLGGGCNTLFPDGEFERPVISTVKLRDLSISGRRIRAESGVRIGTLIGRSIEAGLEGLEDFVGIPGTVGGAVAMNAGCPVRGFGDLVRKLGLVDLATGELYELEGESVDWGYRRSNLRGVAVAWAELELETGSAKALRERARECFVRKRETQPL
ncbi:MAG: FAD-binding protein, partial [Planctomycetota bacterium]